MKLKNLVRVVICFILFMIISFTISQASYNASNKTVQSGEKVTITVTSSQALDAYNLDLENSRRIKI